MKHGYLRRMIDMLTGAYNRRDKQNAEKGRPMQTNIGRLFSIFAWGLEIVHDSCDKVLLWDELSSAKGAVLDRYGENFGVLREGTNDAFYRLLIRVKMIALLSGGDINTVIEAAASLFDLDPTRVELREVFPAKIWLLVDEDDLSEERIETGPIIATVVKRIIACGVGIKIFFRTYTHTRCRLYVGAGALIETRVETAPRGMRPIAPIQLYAGAPAVLSVAYAISPASGSVTITGQAKGYAGGAAFECAWLHVKPKEE